MMAGRNDDPGRLRLTHFEYFALAMLSEAPSDKRGPMPQRHTAAALPGWCTRIRPQHARLIKYPDGRTESGSDDW
jgi:hypothetical protein